MGTPRRSVPVITINGANPLTVEADSNVVYTDLGAKCNDEVWGALQTTSKGMVDRSTIGPYQMKYSCTNPKPWSVTTTITRKIVVADTKCPVCGKFSKAVSVEAGFVYSDVAPTCVDSFDGSVDTTTEGSVNVNKAGIYKLTYTARDASGNLNCGGPLVRFVTVKDTLKPVIALQVGRKYIHIGDGVDTGVNGEGNPASVYFKGKLMAEGVSSSAWIIAAASAAAVGVALLAMTRKTTTTVAEVPV